jgi:general secretion pathway protein F
MMIQSAFAYRAANPKGAIEKGTVNATSAREAREIIASRGLYLLAIQRRVDQHERKQPMSAADLALGLRMLADLLESGLPISRALHAFEELAPRGWRPALPHIRQDVREGRTLAAALASAPVAVPGLVLGIAQAGEAGAGIGPALRRAAELMESAADMRASIRSALAYPMVVAAAGMLSVGVLITIVLPRFARILSDLGQSLPASTRIVMSAAAVARASLLPAAVGVGLALGAWRAWTRTGTGKRSWHRLLLSIPLLGAVRRAAAAARMAHSLSALLESGVAMPVALVHAGRATAAAERAARPAAARAAVGEGEPLSRALEMTDASTPTVVRLARAGEQSGRLATMLDHAARIEQQRADRIVRTAVRMLEPALLLTFASVVALIAAALLQAIYGVRPAA